MDWSKVVPLVLKVISTSRGAPPPGEVRYSLGIRLAALAIALERLPPAVLQASPTGAAVLELMRRGHVAGLVMSQVTPEMQVLDLPPPASFKDTSAGS